ncbi:MAG TPA: SAM-dependent methyltransferase [Flavobacteriales bacterium]|nr:SAM-dependent methyltransferase [Flavobacteriales bacterium]HIN39958.1 SAM-dependent methyltransferase [Flavobacteriales bacterium]
MSGKGKLYLIPTLLGPSNWEKVMPKHIHKVLVNLKYFVAEDIRTSRRYLSKLSVTNIRDLNFSSLNKRTSKEELDHLLDPVKRGNDLGLLSEAGCPCLADPGADLVGIAHQQNIQVVPLVGPSSILLALIGSGMNGQAFKFNGYLPKDRKLRIDAVLKLEKEANKGVTQIFIEAPYRNQHLLEAIVENSNTNTRLCIATDLTLDSEMILTRPVGQWKKKLPSINKKPTVFLLGKEN